MTSLLKNWSELAEAGKQVAPMRTLFATDSTRLVKHTLEVASVAGITQFVLERAQLVYLLALQLLFHDLLSLLALSGQLVFKLDN